MIFDTAWFAGSSLHKMEVLPCEICLEALEPGLWPAAPSFRA